VVTEAGDVFGDTVNVCARLVGAAGQSRSTTQGPSRRSPGLRIGCRRLYRCGSGAAPRVAVCGLWRSDPGVTRCSRAAECRDPQWILKLTCRATIVVEPTGSVKLGRDKTNGLVVTSNKASRVHAHLAAAPAVIADQSSNGTFLAIDSSAPDSRCGATRRCSASAARWPGRPGLRRRRPRRALRARAPRADRRSPRSTDRPRD
jgi:hypothetical protein